MLICVHSSGYVSFQSTLPRGERQSTQGEPLVLANISIHAPTRGATSLTGLLLGNVTDFNPRSHEGSDVEWCTLTMYLDISIHAPTRGATVQSKIVTEQYTISIHAPTRGATIFTGLGIVSDVISIHAPTRGATSAVLLFPVATSNFNPRSHEGSDSNFRQKVLFSLSKNCLKYLILTTNYFN